jgi:N-acetylmuramoyl-L-alanine amidase
MGIQLKHLITASALVALSMVSNAGLAAGNTVTAARVWPAQDYTRITLEANSPLNYKMSIIKDPDRIVVDINDIDLNQAMKALTDKILSSDPYIKQVRVGKFKPGVVRLVVDLKTEVRPNAFTLPPAGEYKNRLVLDIYPVKDPLMAMLEQREKPAATNNQANNNAANNQTTSNSASNPPNSVHGEGYSISATENKPIVEPLPTPDPETADEIAVAEAMKPEPAKPESVKPETKSNQNAKPDEVANLKPLTKDSLREIVIAIDAGHGGEDPGARGANGSHEKDITLMVAKRLKAKIDNEPGMRGVLTRDGDYFIPLHGRVVKARKLQADLFVSIHADAFTNQAARGSSVFALSERGATSASARYLAKKENESDLIGGVSLDDKDPVLARTLLDLSQTATINDSLKLGKAVLGHIGEINTLHKNHVEQAGFAVLKSPDIPSILVETAFISNPEEERKLNDEAYQDKLVSSILAGIKKYFATNPALARTKVASD